MKLSTNNQNQSLSLFPKQEIVFIDAGVEDYQSLVNGVKPGIEIVVLDSKRDGIEQITEVLTKKQFATVHIVSHGSPGCLYLGNSELNLSNLNKCDRQLKSWFDGEAEPLKLDSQPESGNQNISPSPCLLVPPSPHLPIPPSPHLFLYGCNVAAGDAGEEFIEKLHRLTKANIAASTTVVGNVKKGGNWNLDINRGEVSFKSAFWAEAIANYTGVLGIKYVNLNATGGNNGNSWGDAYTDLQSALAAAVNGDQIWVAQGTYKPTIGNDRNATFQLKSGVGIYGGFVGTETSLNERDWESNETILSGDIGTVGNNSDNSYSVVTGSGTDSTAILDGFTVRDGNASGFGSAKQDGGGIYNDNGSPTLNNLTISGNSANSGGGLYNFSSSPTLNNLTISGNTARYSGGLYNADNSSPTLNNSNISGNTASAGAGLYNRSSNPTLNNSTISGNTASAGAGLYNQSSNPTLNNSTISGNTASSLGGGLYNFSSSSPTLNNSTISGNTANSGGGMRNFSSSNPILTNVTISGNSASNGGGIANSSSNSQIRNSILWDNTASNNPETDGYNNFTNSIVKGSDDNGSWNTALGTDSGGNLDIDPQFVDAANRDFRLKSTSPAINAGDNNLLASDTSDLDGDGDRAELIPFDLDGNSRILNSTVDMGAYEKFVNPVNLSISSATGTETDTTQVTIAATADNAVSGNQTIDLAVTGTEITPTDYNLSNTTITIPDGTTTGSVTFTIADDIAAEAAETAQFTISNPSSGIVLGTTTTANLTIAANDLVVTNTNDSGEGSLRQAITNANSFAGTDTITFDVSLNNQTITLTSGELLITDAVTIQGLGANNLTVSGNNNTSRVFKIENNSNQINVTIEGLTITGGNSNDDGGGIYNRENLTLKNIVVSNNQAADDGGGIRNDGNLTIINSTLADNASNGDSQTSGGGGLLNTTSASLTVVNSTFSGNTAKSGGAIRNDGILNLINSTLSDNTANFAFGGGGAIANSTGNVDIQNSTITNNTAAGVGGGVSTANNVTIANSIIAGNVDNKDVATVFNGSFTSGGNNLVGNGDGSSFTNGNNGDIVGNSANPIDPLLGNLQNNGGLTQTHALLSGSPAINAGNNSKIAPDTFDIDGDGNTTEIPFEQRGVGFQRIIDSTVDIGAYEIVSVVEVNATTADGTYKTGDTVEITVKFAKAVSVDTVGGTPQLTLETGTNDRIATYSSGSGSDTLSFIYTVQPGDESLDLDYISKSALQLNGSTIKDNNGSNVDLTLPNPGETDSLGDNKDIVIDAIAPAVTLNSTASATVNSTFNVTAQFSEAVTDFIETDITSTNSTISNFSGSGNNYSFDITPTTTGSVTVDINQDVAQDNATNNNTAATQLTREADLTNPTVTGITASPLTISDSTTSFTLTVEYSEDMDIGVNPNITIENPQNTISFANGSWNDSKTYIATYSVNDANEEITNIDVTVENAQDTVGNIQAAFTSTDLFSIDNQNPGVTLNSTAPATVNSTFNVTAEFSEAVTNFDSNDISLTNATISNFNGSGENYSFDITPINSGSVTVDINSAVATDNATNNNTAATQLTREADLTNPTVTGITASTPTISDSTTSFTLTVEYSEDMDTNVNPNIIFPVENPTNTISFQGGSWSNNTTYTATYNLTDANEELTNIDVTVENAEDKVGNIQAAFTSTDLFSIDNQNPGVTLTSTAPATVNSTFNVTAQFTEAVNNFDSNDIRLTNATVDNFVGSGNNYSFDITPTNTGSVTVDINSAVAQDNATNNNTAATQLTREADLTLPTVVDIAASTLTISDSTTSFTLTVEYSEDMDIGVNPDITIENLQNTITFDSGSWNDAKTYIATYTVTDANEELTNIDVTVENAQDKVGNTQTGFTKNDLFSIDNQNPTVTLNSTAPTTVNSEFNVTAEFSEAVNNFDINDITLTNATVDNFVGSGNNYSFDITPTNTGSVTVDINSAVAQDNATNNNTAATQLTREADLTNPTVTGITASTLTISDSTTSFTLTVEYSEDMDTNVNPNISFPTENPNNTISFQGGSWSNNTTYTATYNLTDANEELTDIDVTVENAQDTVGNIQAGFTSNDLFSIDNLNPTVTLTSTAAATVNSTFNVTATFSEAVTDFIETDITLTNSTISNFVGNGNNYSFDVTPTNSGNVTVDINSAVATDNATNNNIAATQLTREADLTTATVTQITASTLTISDSTTSFTLTVEYSEDMDTNVNPSITFPVENPTNTISFTNGSWNDSKTYISTYTVTDANEELTDIDVTVENAQDKVGNTQAGFTSNDLFNIDNQNPGVTLTSTAPATVNSTFNVTAQFSEAVTDFIETDITSTNSTISNFSGSGANYSFDVTPTTTGSVTVDINSAVAQDNATNNNIAATQLTREADLTTATVTQITASTPTISDSTTSFTLTVEYSEDMDTNVNPSITFPVENPTNTISFTNGSWNDSKTYISTYTVTDANEELTDIDVTVENAQDKVGNTQAGFTSNDLFNIDNQNPDAPSITGFTQDTNTTGDGITGDNTLIINGSAEANNQIEVFRNSQFIDTTTADDSGNWSFDYTNTTLEDNTYTFSAIAKDAAGNASDTSTSFNITVDAVNDAPILDNTGDMTLSAINEDDINNNGTLITDIISSGGGDRITDINIDALEGIAVTSVDNTNGNWQYSIDGSNWNNFGTPNDNNSRLLAADNSTKIRFVPNTDYEGTVTNGITFRAWDTTTGDNGNTLNTTSNGGNSAFSSETETAAIIVNPINDAPKLENNALTIDEALSVTLSNTNLSATDVDNDDADLTFNISNLQNGNFEVENITAISFTQQQINNGEVKFIHDGSENPPSYDVEVSDGEKTDSGSANITFTNTNDAPTLGNNTLTIDEAGSVTFTNTNLSATDVDNDDTTLIFTVSNLQNGEFQLNSVTTTSFTQQQINNGEVKFIHDGSENQPSYDVEVSDGNLTDNGSANIIFTNINDAPTLGNNTLTIDESGSVTFTNTNLSATDVDNDDATLIFTVSNLQNGEFQINSVVATSFTQQQISNGEVEFIHDGSENQPSYDVEVSDGEKTDSGSANITFTNTNDAPTLGNNTLTIDESGSVTFTNTNLSATDVDNDDITLIFTVSNLQNGNFEVENITAISFTQQQINNGEVKFIHDGSENPPSYDVEVSDGEKTDSGSANITFTNINDAPTLGNNALTIDEALSVTFTNTNLSATDVDNNDITLIFTVSNLQNGEFQLNSVTATSFTQQQITDGLVKFIHDGSENPPSYDVEVSDGDLTEKATATVNFTNINDAPIVKSAIASVTTPQDTTFDFTLPADTFTDSDIGDTLTYSATLEDDSQLPTWLNFANGSFTGTPTSDNLGEINIKVTATDTAGASVSNTFTLKVENVNQAPVINDAVFSIKENSLENTVIGIIAANDPDEVLNFALVSGNLDLDKDGKLAFAINPNTGEIAVNDKDDIDFETTPSFNLQVTATDAGGLSDSANININLIDVAPAKFDVNQSRNGIFTLDGGEKTNIKFTLTNIDADNVNEIGVFVVDENGNIDGLAPGSDGFLNAALNQSQIIFSALSKNPDEFAVENIQRVIEVDSNARLQFFMVSNGTTDSALAELESSGKTSLPILFSTSENLRVDNLNSEGFTLEWEDSTGGDDDFNDIQLNAALTQDSVKGTKLQAKKELIDLRDITDDAVVNVEVYREAAFDNLIGFYKISDVNGGIDTDGDGIADINPNDAGYKDAALTNRITSLDLLATENQTPTTVDGILEAGSILAPFIIADGTFDEAINNNAEVYFAFLGANSDKTDHIRLLGDNTFGFEDMVNSGDKDFNDAIVKINF